MLSPTGDNLINCDEGLKSQIPLEILNKLLFSNETALFTFTASLQYPLVSSSLHINRPQTLVITNIKFRAPIQLHSCWGRILPHSPWYYVAPYLGVKCIRQILASHAVLSKLPIVCWFLGGCGWGGRIHSSFDMWLKFLISPFHLWTLGKQISGLWGFNGRARHLGGETSFQSKTWEQILNFTNLVEKIGNLCSLECKMIVLILHRGKHRYDL